MPRPFFCFCQEAQQTEELQLCVLVSFLDCSLRSPRSFTIGRVRLTTGTFKHSPFFAFLVSVPLGSIPPTPSTPSPGFTGLSRCATNQEECSSAALLPFASLCPAYFSVFGPGRHLCVAFQPTDCDSTLQILPGDTLKPKRNAVFPHAPLILSRNQLRISRSWKVRLFLDWRNPPSSGTPLILPP